ncbi:MAG: hypothetical protein MJZ25_06690 [Fibrobacter sp.]|nr:hypothetical protein [Fibrobacter sp.]
MKKCLFPVLVAVLSQFAFAGIRYADVDVEIKAAEDREPRAKSFVQGSFAVELPRISGYEYFKDLEDYQDLYFSGKVSRFSVDLGRIIPKGWVAYFAGIDIVFGSGDWHFEDSRKKNGTATYLELGIHAGAKFYPLTQKPALEGLFLAAQLGIGYLGCEGLADDEVFTWKIEFGDDFISTQSVDVGVAGFVTFKNLSGVDANETYEVKGRVGMSAGIQLSIALKR